MDLRDDVVPQARGELRGTGCMHSATLAKQQLRACEREWKREERGYLTAAALLV